MSVKGVVRTKAGVVFSIIAPAGFRILSAIDRTADVFGHDLEITSACDGAHSGPHDPHHTGEAYDIHTKDFSNNELKQLVLDSIMRYLGEEHFFGFLEDPGTDNEHLHVQRKKDTVYP